MNTKFTKAPWKIEFTGPHWNNKELQNIEIQHGEQGECICDTVYNEADAHLIACAPDMYEMLEKCQQKFADLGYYSRVEEIESLLKRARGE